MGDKYQKASRYDLQAQRYNHRVFLELIRQQPWKAFAISAFFAACSLMLLMILVPGSVAGVGRPRIVAVLAAVVRGYFAWQGILGLLAKK